MKLRLFFYLPLIGAVEIHTSSETGHYEKLFVNGFDHTEDGDVELMVADGIDQKDWIFAMNDAVAAGGVFRQKESA